MASFNKVIIAGNLTRDPELRYTPKGTAVARFTLAVNRVWRTETGETKEEVSFIDVDAFGRQAENIGKYMKKGRPLLVEGRLKQDSWEDKTTQQKRSKLMVVLESFSFIDSNRGDAPAGGAPSENFRSRPSSAPTAQEPAPDDMGGGSEDEVPF